MEATNTTARLIDVTGLPDQAIRAVESIVTLLRDQKAGKAEPPSFATREEWVRAIFEWAESHQPRQTFADWDRESIYNGIR